MLKKLASALVITGILVCSVAAIPASADTALTTDNQQQQLLSTDLSATAPDGNSTVKTNEKGQYSIKNLTGYADWQSMLAQAKTTQTSIKSKRTDLQTALKSLQPSQRKTLKDTLTSNRTELKDLYTQFKTLCDTQKNNWATMKTAHQSKNITAMQDAMNSIVDIRSQKNTVLTNISAKLDEMIALVNNAPAPANTKQNVQN